MRRILAKPFEWLMRLFGVINLSIDGNSEWYCIHQEDINIIVDEAFAFEASK